MFLLLSWELPCLLVELDLLLYLIDLVGLLVSMDESDVLVP